MGIFTGIHKQQYDDLFGVSGKVWILSLQFTYDIYFNRENYRL